MINVSHLKKQLIYLRWQGLLQDPEEGVGLAAHRHRQAQVFHAVLDVALCQQLLSQLYLWRSTTWLVSLQHSMEMAKIAYHLPRAFETCIMHVNRVGE